MNAQYVAYQLVDSPSPSPGLLQKYQPFMIERRKPVSTSRVRCSSVRSVCSTTPWCLSCSFLRALSADASLADCLVLEEVAMDDVVGGARGITLEDTQLLH